MRVFALFFTLELCLVTSVSAIDLLYTLPGGSEMADDFSSLSAPFDFDQDGYAEVLCRSIGSPPALEVRELNGTLLWTYVPLKSELCPTCSDEWDWGYPRFVDVDIFPGPELVFNWEDSYGEPDGVAIVSTTTGQVINNFHEYDVECHTDFNGDGFLETLFWAHPSGDPGHYEIWGYADTAELNESPSSLGASPLRLTSMGNPSRGRCDMAISSASPGPVRVRIFDVAGRLVRDLGQMDLEGGPTTIEWNGVTERGSIAPAGQYLVIATRRSEMPVKLKIALVN